MTKIAFLRHGPTEWNAAGRIQGHTDIALSETGLAKMSGLRLPFVHPRLYASPLLRARQTAQALGLGDPIFDTRLMEQNWGAWEGLTRDECSTTLRSQKKRLFQLKKSNWGRALVRVCHRRRHIDREK